MTADLLGRKSLYRYLERDLGDLTHLPRVMTAQQGRNHVRVERIFEHDGQVVLSMSGQRVGSWFKSAERPIAYVLVDLKRQRAQAAPHPQAFQSAYNLDLSQVKPGIAERFAYRYGYKVERAVPHRTPRLTVPKTSKFRGNGTLIKLKAPPKYRAQTWMRKLSDRLRFRFIENPAAIPVQKRLSVRQSWLGALSQEKNLGKALHNIGIPRDQLQGFPTLSRDQRYSRFCNLSTQKALDWLHDRNYQFVERGPRRNLLFPAEKPPVKRVQPSLQSVEHNRRSTTVAAKLSSGKTVKLSLTSGSKEAWDQVLATPIRQQAERTLARKGKLQETQGSSSRSLSHSYQRHSRHRARTLKIEERSCTQAGEVLKIRLQGGQSVYCAISDSSPEAVQTLLSPKVQMERQQTPFVPSRHQQPQNRTVARPQPKPNRPKP